MVGAKLENATGALGDISAAGSVTDGVVTEGLSVSADGVCAEGVGAGAVVADGAGVVGALTSGVQPRAKIMMRRMDKKRMLVFIKSFFSFIKL